MALTPLRKRTLFALGGAVLYGFIRSFALIQTFGSWSTCGGGRGCGQFGLHLRWRRTLDKADVSVLQMWLSACLCLSPCVQCFMP